MSHDGPWPGFLLSYCDIELETLLSALEPTSQHTFLVDGSLLIDYSLQLCSELLSEPRVQLSALQSGAVVAQRLLLEQYRQQEHSGIASYTVKHNLQVRLHNLPDIPELVRNRVPTCADVGKYLLMVGTVIRTGSTKVLKRHHLWRCAICQGIIETTGLFELRYKVIPPKRCVTETCRGYKFKLVQDEMAGCSDYQEIKIQEKVERLDMGTIPRSMTVILEYDLVDTCKAGDDVTIYGIVSQMWDQPTADTRCSLETVLHANFIEINNEQHSKLDVTDTAITRHYAHWRRYKDTPMSGRNLILASFCPEVYQLYVVKLAALLVMLGGVTHTDGRGTKVRGECHLLMVGDPGTGKSQILKYASKLSTRSVITTGVGCTKAGLTVAAVKDGGEWVLEAGAMVLADGGVCCVDELSSIRECDRVAIHEAMEQQTISVAKAGLVCKLNTRTTVLAATNPRGSYDITQPISANVPIGTPLLSRFDLILILFDDHTPAWDSMVAGFLLKEEAVLQQNDILKNYTADTMWSFQELQQYTSHVKGLTPKLTGPAKELLGRYYRRQREQITRNVSRTTIRMLESLVRLSQAHAKLMMHDVVLVEDAVVTISLVECTMLNSSLLGSVSVLHSVYPADPEQEFAKQKSMVLEVLGLPPDFGDTSSPSKARVQPLRPARTEENSDIVGEVPSFQINTQELRKELQLQERKRSRPALQEEESAAPRKSSARRSSKGAAQGRNHGDPALGRASPPKKSRDHVGCDVTAASRDVTAASRDSTHSSSLGSGVRKCSFAELVRDFKAKKRARITEPKPKQIDLAESIDDILKDDFSEILSAAGCLATPALPTISSSHTPDSLQLISPNRHNTPVTRMYDKFNTFQLGRDKENSSQQHHSQVKVGSKVSAAGDDQFVKPVTPSNTVTPSQTRTTTPLYTPYINTQSVGLTSSSKNAQLPPPPPHFAISPVIAGTVISGPRDVTSPSDDVTPDELRAKTTKPKQASLFHDTSAEKLKKFAYKPRDK